jgi:hypothetical protein
MLLAVNVKMNTSLHKMLFDRLAFSEDGQGSLVLHEYGNSDSGPQFSIGKVLKFAVMRRAPIWHSEMSNCCSGFPSKTPSLLERGLGAIFVHLKAEQRSFKTSDFVTDETAWRGTISRHR